jgi:hypothetical protein
MNQGKSFIFWAIWNFEGHLAHTTVKICDYSVGLVFSDIKYADTCYSLILLNESRAGMCPQSGKYEWAGQREEGDCSLRILRHPHTTIQKIWPALRSRSRIILMDSEPEPQRDAAPAANLMYNICKNVSYLTLITISKIKNQKKSVTKHIC